MPGRSRYRNSNLQPPPLQQQPPQFQVLRLPNHDGSGGWYPHVDGHVDSRGRYIGQEFLPQASQGPPPIPPLMQQHQQDQVMPLMGQRQQVQLQQQQQFEQGFQVVQAVRPLPLVQGEGQDKSSIQTLEKKGHIFKVHDEDEWDPDHWTAGLHCSVCFELHTESYVLQCGHTWCNACIEAMMKSERQRTPRRPMDYIPVVCPSCRHTQPYGQYTRYAPRNRALEEAVSAWMNSPDRAKLLVLKDDIGVQVNLDLDDLERKAVSPPKAMSVQTEEWQPQKTYMSIGHQVCLPAEGSTVSTQTTLNTRDAHVQTTPSKQRTKCTQTMFTRTRASGVQVGPPGGFLTTHTPPESNRSTLHPSPCNSHYSPPPMALSLNDTPPVSTGPVELENFVGSLFDHSESAAAILAMTPPPTPPSPLSSTSASPNSEAPSSSRRRERRWRNKRQNGVDKSREKSSKIKKSLFPNHECKCPQEELDLEYYLGDDLADVVRPLIGIDVVMVVALVFHLVFDWRHLVSSVVTDAPTISPERYYTTYTVDMLGDAIFMSCIGAVGFFFGTIIFLRDAGCWLLDKI